MNTEKIKVVTEEYVNRINALEESMEKRAKEENKSTEMNHFQHIARNLMNRIYPLPDLIKLGIREWAKERKSYLETLNLAKAYMNLLKEFPKFKEGEFFDGEKGYFPEIPDSDSRQFIREAYKKLKTE